MKKANYFCNANQAKDYYVLLRDQLFQQNRKKFLNQIKFKDHYQQKGMISQQQNKSNQRYKMRKSNSKSSININPILQPQQPQNYLNLSKQNKKISIISCKSQPIDLTINQANQNKNISMKCSQHQNQYVPENYHENDNKKTRKHFTKPYDHFQQTAKNYHQNQYYAVDNLENLKKQKTLKNISSNYHNHLKNEDTLRIKKSQCEHKKSKKKQSENLKSLQALQNIEKRISFCQAYLNLSERKTNFLAKQVDFLVNKQFLRESKKYHKISSERLGHCHSQKIIFPYHGEPLPTKEFFKEKRHNCNHKLQKQHQRQQVLNKSERNSSNKFHFRSSENKFSRMKQLLYFHEKQKNQSKYDHQNHLKPTKALKNYDEKTSIYNTNSRIKQKNRKEQKNYKRYEENSDEQLKHNEDLRSRGKNYQNNESYLLQQEDQYQTNFKMQNNNLKFNRILPAQQQIPYIKSEIALESENQQKQKDQRSLNEENGQKNIYLTRQFQPFTQKNHKIGINQFNYQSSEKEIIRHATDSKIGHFKLVSKNSNQVQKNQNPIKSQNKPHILVDSGKSSQTFKQKQYTFIRSGQSSKKDDLLDNYQVIESYGNSDKYQKDTSQVDSRQSQLIEEFNELVVAVINEETPMKKKIIQEQIYRTSKELKELNQQKVKSDSKNTYR